MLIGCKFSFTRVTRWRGLGRRSLPKILFSRSLRRRSRRSDRERRSSWRDFIPPNLPVNADCVRRVNDTTYAVGDPAFGRAVRYLVLCFGFCALRAQKPGCPL